MQRQRLHVSDHAISSRVRQPLPPWPGLTSAAATNDAPASAVTPAAAFASAEDQALERATRPQRGVPLTSEAKKARRRLQYKLHQRRHRASQRATTEQLESDVAQLRATVAALAARQRQLQLQHQQQQPQPLPPPSPVFHARGTDSGAPVRIAVEYIRMFQHGYDLRTDAAAAQEQFLRSVMAPDVAGPDYEGVDLLVDQWRLYGAFFPRTQFLFESLEVETAGDLTVVVLDVVLAIRGGRAGIAAIYPGLRSDEAAIQTLVGAALHVPGKMRLTFGADGRCAWLGAELDFVAGLQRALGSLDRVHKCLHGANMSFATGQIALDLHDDGHYGVDNDVCGFPDDGELLGTRERGTRG